MCEQSISESLYHSTSKHDYDLCAACHDKGSAGVAENGPYNFFYGSNGMNSRTIVDTIIKPVTHHLKCSYSNLLSIQEPEALSRGKEFYFCSHTWSTSFTDMVDQLTLHFSPENQSIWRPKGSKILQWTEIYLFIDIFCMNQWRPEDVEFDALLVTLKETVEDATEILTIIDPEGVILTRIWCL